MSTWSGQIAPSHSQFSAWVCRVRPPLLRWPCFPLLILSLVKPNLCLLPQPRAHLPQYNATDQWSAGGQSGPYLLPHTPNTPHSTLTLPRTTSSESILWPQHSLDPPNSYGHSARTEWPIQVTDLFQHISSPTKININLEEHGRVSSLSTASSASSISGTSWTPWQYDWAAHQHQDLDPDNYRPHVKPSLKKHHHYLNIIPALASYLSAMFFIFHRRLYFSRPQTSAIKVLTSWSSKHTGHIQMICKALA